MNDDLPPIVDGHLDLAYNVLNGRDVANSSAQDIRALEGADAPNAAMVTLSDLERGRVAVAFATLFAMPAGAALHGSGERAYRTADEASRLAGEQLDVYERWAADGRVRLVTDRASLEEHLSAWARDGRVGLVVLMEGADPILDPSDLERWWRRGVRLFGPSWHATRYAGGTGEPGGLTAAGRELVAGLRELGAVMDASHMAEAAFWEALELGPRVIASHSNARALVPGDRQLSDEMIRAIGARDGVIGLVLFNRFLEARWSREDRSVPVTVTGQVRHHAEHVAGLIGWERVGIGSDMDGGLGRDETPIELDTAADLHRVEDAVPAGARDGFLGENWLRFLRDALP